MAVSELVRALDGIQAAMRPSLKEHGFRVRGRTFNRLTEGGLTQVINFQMGPSDPPGITYAPGLRENMYGLFTVNLGVYIPEVATLNGGGLAKGWVQEYRCSIRDRLGPASGSERDLWWKISDASDVISRLQPLLLSFGLMFLERFRSRDVVLAELEGQGENLDNCLVPRIVSAIILAERNDLQSAKTLMKAQCQQVWNKRHPEYVRELALRMGLGPI